MIIKSLREFIVKCPHLQEFEDSIKVNVNYLGDESPAYSIEAVSCNPIIKKYIDDSSVRQFDFKLSSREAYSSDVLKNIETSGFYEHFSEWLEEQNNNGNLPILEGNKKVKSIKALSTGYLSEKNVDKARYEIKMRLIYFIRRI